MDCCLHSHRHHFTRESEGYLEAGTLGSEPQRGKSIHQIVPRELPFTRFKSYQWRHPDTAATLIQRSLHLSNLLLNHPRLSGEVPQDSTNIAKEIKTRDKASSRYKWTDESPIDLSLCALAFETSDSKLLKLAKSEDFGC